MVGYLAFFYLLKLILFLLWKGRKDGGWNLMRDCLSYGEVKTTLMHFVFNMTAILQA